MWKIIVIGNEFTLYNLFKVINLNSNIVKVKKQNIGKFKKHSKSGNY